MAGETPLDRVLFGLSLIAGPALFALSSFAWRPDGEYGVTAGATLVMGSVFWIIAFVGIFGELRSRAPRYAAWGLLGGVYGAVCGGAAFAFQGLFVELHRVTHQQSLAALNEHPVVANAIFWVGGPAFPLTLLVLGIVLARTGAVPWWTGATLALGGALFPVARIPRIELVAHGVDLLMLIPAVSMGWNVLRGRSLGGRS